MPLGTSGFNALAVSLLGVVFAIFSLVTFSVGFKATNTATGDADALYFIPIKLQAGII